MTRLKLFSESSSLLESFPQEFNKAANSAKAKREIGDYLSRYKGISAQNLDIGSLMKPIKSSRDPSLKSSIVILMISGYSFNLGKYAPMIIAFDGSRTIVDAVVSRQPKGRASGYKYQYASQSSWTSLLDSAEASWVIDYNSLEKDVDGLHASRVAAQRGSIDRDRRHAGGYGYDKSGYYIDPSKYRRMLSDIKGKQGAEKLKSEFESTKNEYDQLVDKAFSKLRDEFNRGSEDSSKIFDNLRELKYNFDRCLKKVSDMTTTNGWDIDYVIKDIDRLKEKIKDFSDNYLKESLMKIKEDIDSSKIKPSEVTQEQWDSGDYCLVSKNEQVPMLWDAGFKISGSNLVITGGLNPGGPEGGRAELTIPIKDLDRNYEVFYTQEESLTRPKRKIEAKEAPESQILSPEMSAVYNEKGAVPIQIQLLRKAVAEETKSISDYEGFIKQGYFTPEENAIIQEIADDEKDHIVKWTRLLSAHVDKTYKDFGNESYSKPQSNRMVESIKINLFKK